MPVATPVHAASRTVDGDPPDWTGIPAATVHSASEIDTLGFHLFRAESVDGKQVQITKALIPGQNPGSPVGAEYVYQDTDIAPGQTYCYWLEHINNQGDTNRFGPVKAIPEPYRICLPLIFR